MPIVNALSVAAVTKHRNDTAALTNPEKRAPVLSTPRSVTGPVPHSPPVKTRYPSQTALASASSRANQEGTFRASPPPVSCRHCESTSSAMSLNKAWIAGQVSQDAMRAKLAIVVNAASRAVGEYKRLCQCDCDCEGKEKCQSFVMFS